MVLPRTPVCSFEKLDPSDIASAIRTSLGPLSRTFVRAAPLGLGYEAFLKWAVQDVEVAAASTNPDEQARFSISALMNARRSLSCLTDQYLQRDAFGFCRDTPRDADGKARLLVSRGVFDTLAAGALSRAVHRRNCIEHGYEGIAHVDARDTVHLIRATVENCVTKSDPYRSPALFGTFVGEYTNGSEGENHAFHGWSGLLFVIARCETPPWFGIVVPSSETVATARKVPLSELSCDELVQVLAALEAQSSTDYSEYQEATLRGTLACLGLTN